MRVSGLLIDYTNWRGVRGKCRIEPIKLFKGSNEWHPEDQYLLRAKDLDSGEIRDFALKGIHSWEPIY